MEGGARRLAATSVLPNVQRGEDSPMPGLPVRVLLPVIACGVNGTCCNPPITSPPVVLVNSVILRAWSFARMLHSTFLGNLLLLFFFHSMPISLNVALNASASSFISSSVLAFLSSSSTLGIPPPPTGLLAASHSAPPTLPSSPLSPT